MHHELDAFPKGCERRFELREPREVLEVQYPIDLWRMPVEAFSQFGLADLHGAHGLVESDLGAVDGRDVHAEAAPRGGRWNIAPVNHERIEDRQECVDRVPEGLLFRGAEGHSLRHIWKGHRELSVVWGENNWIPHIRLPSLWGAIGPVVLGVGPLFQTQRFLDAVYRSSWDVALTAVNGEGRNLVAQPDREVSASAGLESATPLGQPALQLGARHEQENTTELFIIQQNCC